MWVSKNAFLLERESLAMKLKPPTVFVQSCSDDATKCKHNCLPEMHQARICVRQRLLKGSYLASLMRVKATNWQMPGSAL